MAITTAERTALTQSDIAGIRSETVGAERGLLIINLKCAKQSAITVARLSDDRAEVERALETARGLELLIQAWEG